MKNKLVLLLVDGLGVSASRRGNAFVGADPATLNSLWQNSNHALLSTKPESVSETGFLTEPENNYSIIASGREIVPIYDSINLSLRDGSFFENEGLIQSFDHAVQHLSSVHLIGNISSNTFYSDLRHLKAILEYAKSIRFYQVFIHLIVDDSFSSAEALISQLEKLQDVLEKTEVAQIVSVCGMQYLVKPEYEKQAYDCFRFGKGKSALTLKQAVMLHHKKYSELSSLSPVSIMKDKCTAKIGDLDTIIIFNHNIRPIERFIFSFIQTGTRSSRASNTYLLADRLSIRGSKVNCFFKRKACVGMIDILSKHRISGIYFSESFRSELFKEYFGVPDGYPNFIINSPSPKDYLRMFPRAYEDMLARIHGIFNRSDHDFILIYLPILERQVFEENYSDVVKVIQYIDRFIAVVQHSALSRGYATMISSAYGIVDNLIKQSDNSFMPTKSPAPLIFSTVDARISQTETKLTEIPVNDLLRRDNTLCDIAPTVLNYFGIKNSEATYGKSILS